MEISVLAPKHKPWMAVEGEGEMIDALVKTAAERIAAHQHEYPSSDKMPWNKLTALYSGPEVSPDKERLAKLVAEKARKETLAILKRVKGK